MTEPTEQDEVEILIPKAIRDRRKVVIRESCVDFGALIDALPSASPSPLDGVLSAALADANVDTCKAWIARAIRALPTQADMQHPSDDDAEPLPRPGKSVRPLVAAWSDRDTFVLCDVKLEAVQVTFATNPRTENDNGVA